MDLTWLALAVGVLAMLVVAYLAWSISKEPAGTPQINKIIDCIEENANVSIKRRHISILVEHPIEDGYPEGAMVVIAS